MLYQCQQTLLPPQCVSVLMASILVQLLAALNAPLAIFAQTIPCPLVGTTPTLEMDQHFARAMLAITSPRETHAPNAPLVFFVWLV